MTTLYSFYSKKPYISRVGLKNFLLKEYVVIRKKKNIIIDLNKDPDTAFN